MRTRTILEVVALVGLALLMVSGANAAWIMWGPSPNGTHETLVVDGVRRDYLLHVPDTLPEGERVPLVLVLHGAYGWGDQIARTTDFSQKADEESFIVAYPEGRSTLPRIWQFWNADYCCYAAMDAGHDDLGFLDALITHLLATQSVDPARIYLAGFSNGGMLASWYAAEHPERVAALAAVASTIGAHDTAGRERWAIPDAKGPVPVFEIHGLKDGGVPWDGSPSRRVSAWKPIAVNDTVAYWLAANGMDAVPDSELTWADGNIQLTSWVGDDPEQEVLRLLARDAGHSWPGGDGAPFFAKPTQDADATALVWDFFQRHSN